MKIKKLYKYTNKRRIWRLIPTASNKLVIEERDGDTKEVFFECIDIPSGKKIFHALQIEEKYWLGIETIYNDVIFFHRYANREMPVHNGIIALDINTQKILWQNNDYVFLFIWENKIYCYKSAFEGRKYFTVDIYSGEFIEDLGEDSESINLLREKSFDSIDYSSYLFPEPFEAGTDEDSPLHSLITKFKEDHLITGKPDFIKYGDLALFNAHAILSDGFLRNTFWGIDILTKKIIFEEELNSKTKTFIPDSFFTKDNFLFLLKEKNILSVCLIIK